MAHKFRDLVAKTPHIPPAGRGRLLGTGDIIERMTVKNKHGVLVGPSPWTVTHHVCPEGKMRLGGQTFWYESDFENWLDAQRQQVA